MPPPLRGSWATTWEARRSTCPTPRRSRRGSRGSGTVDRLALAALDRDLNSVADYDVAKAIRLVTLKLVGYTETVHALLGRLTPDASIVIYGGLAKLRPYPGSTTITTINTGWTDWSGRWPRSCPRSE